jgi:hypothetical protein
MKTFLIGLLSGIAFNLLYNKFTNTNTNTNRDDRILLLDSSKSNRKCHCRDQYCTCGRHVL